MTKYIKIVFILTVGFMCRDYSKTGALNLKRCKRFYGTSCELVNHIDIPVLAMGTHKPESEKSTLADDVYFAIQIGYRHIDTAPYYQNEEEVGRGIFEALRTKVVTREELFITGKLRKDMHNERDVVISLVDSLKKLQISYFDLFLIHTPISQDELGYPTNITLDETWLGMEECYRLKLARSIGVCYFSISEIETILHGAVVKPSVVQIEAHPALTQDQLIEEFLFRNITVMAYRPFGFMDNKTSKIEPRPSEPRLVKIAQRLKKTVFQVVLRYALQMYTIPVPIAKDKEELKQFIDIFDFELQDKDMHLINGFNSYKSVFDV